MPEFKSGPDDTRPFLDFDIPESERMYETDPKMVTFRPLSAMQDQDAYNVAAVSNYNVAILSAERIRRSVVALDGQPVDQAGGWFERCSPKTREVLQSLCSDVNDASAEGKAKAKASRRVRAA